MSSQTFRTSQLRALMKLVREAREIPPVDSDRSRHLVSGMLGILGASVGGCVTDCDFLPGGRGAFAAVVLEGWDSTTLPVLQVLSQAGSAFNPSIRAMMGRCPTLPGAEDAASRRELIDESAWYRSAFFEEHLRPAHLDEGLYACRRTEDPSVVQGMGFYRERNDRPFTEEDRNLLLLFQQECGPMLAPPQSAVDEQLRAKLSPRERETLQLILEGLGDKEIADRLGISRHTVNQYTKSIYRRFRVHSRTALIVRLLRDTERH